MRAAAVPDELRLCRDRSRGKFSDNMSKDLKVTDYAQRSSIPYCDIRASLSRHKQVNWNYDGTGLPYRTCVGQHAHWPFDYPGVLYAGRDRDRAGTGVLHHRYCSMRESGRWGNARVRRVLQKGPSGDAVHRGGLPARLREDGNAGLGNGGRSAECAGDVRSGGQYGSLSTQQIGKVWAQFNNRNPRFLTELGGAVERRFSKASFVSGKRGLRQTQALGGFALRQAQLGTPIL